jgi:hypothetical protein
MVKCNRCGTQNDFIYLGIYAAKCTNISCDNFDEKTYLDYTKHIESTKPKPLIQDSYEESEQQTLDMWATYRRTMQFP